MTTKATTTAKTTKTAATTAAKPSKLIRLVAVGDSMAYNSLNQAAQSGSSYDYLPLMKTVQPVFAKAAISICSQSVPASGAAGGGISGPPTFNAPTEFPKSLIAGGCNVFDTASPNANDKGQAGIDATIANFIANDKVLAYAGTNSSAEDRAKVRYFKKEGLKFAYLSYTVSSNVAPSTPFGVNVYSDALVDQQVAEARKNANITIVSMHWGTDQSEAEDTNQNNIAQHLADLNVDIVLGNGPHVIQPAKVLAGKDKHQTLVWFSLGNFLHTQNGPNTMYGAMAVMDIDSATQQLHNPRVLPLYMHYEWTAEQKDRHSDPDLLARKNFQLVPLDQATELLAKSQNGTTVQAQQERIKTIVNKYFTVPVVTTADL